MALSELVLALLVLAHAARSTPAQSYSTTQELYDSLNAQEKEYFIRYQLGMAVMTEHTPRLPGDISVGPPVPIPDDIMQRIKDVSSQLPTDFSSRLYELVTKQYSLSYKQVRTLVRSGQVCNPRGECLYPKDVGSSCCPF